MFNTLLFLSQLSQNRHIQLFVFIFFLVLDEIDLKILFPCFFYSSGNQTALICGPINLPIKKSGRSLRTSRWPALDNVLCQKTTSESHQRCEGQNMRLPAEEKPRNQDSSPHFPLQGEKLLSLLFLFHQIPSFGISWNTTHLCAARSSQTVRWAWRWRLFDVVLSVWRVSVVQGSNCLFEFMSSTRIRESTQPPAPILFFAF